MNIKHYLHALQEFVGQRVMVICNAVRGVRLLLNAYQLRGLVVDRLGVQQLSMKRLGKLGLLLLLLSMSIHSSHSIGWTAASSGAEAQVTFLPMAVRHSPPRYFISPTGNDSNSGESPAEPWATFDYAWTQIVAGDTLILMDGVYFQTLNPNQRNGTSDQPITIRAQNDGQAIIDGEYLRPVIKVGDTWGGIDPGAIGNYYIVEGIVARNSSEAVVRIFGDNNIFRRISAYDANTDGNHHVIAFGSSAENNLLEDCVASGSGRKMIVIFKGEYNVIRRCVADWRSWDGREWSDCWPWGDGVEIYNASNNIVENVINMGRNPTFAVSINSNHLTAASNNNQILGTVSIRAGANPDGSMIDWGTERPQPTEHTCIRDFNWPGQRSSFSIFGQGQLEGNVLRDIVAWGSAGLGLVNTIVQNGPGPQNSIIDHATIFNNGLDAPVVDGGVGTNALPEHLSRFTVTNSYIEGTAYSGSGARLDNRYVNGELTNVPLWPWPMEDRVQAELGISVTAEIAAILAIEPTQPAPNMLADHLWLTGAGR